MPHVDVDRERINVFHVGDEYLFSHYFEDTELFNALRSYYNSNAYRFEVPADEFEEVQEQLRDAFYEPAVIEEVEPYCVVKRKYTEHAEILRNSVMHWDRGERMFFLMKSDLAVREAVEAGATKLEDTNLVSGI